MQDQHLQPSLAARAARCVIVAPLRALWRHLVGPLLDRLPSNWGARLRSLAHYAKLTLVHGQTVSFLDPVSDAREGDGRVVVAPRRGKDSEPVLPPWIVAEMKALEQIEPELAPTPAHLRKFHVYRTPMEMAPARVYAHCSAVIAEQRPDLIILVPCLVRGGADLGVLHHVDAARKAGVRVLLIATMDAASPWKDRLPADTVLLEYGRLAKGLSTRAQKLVLARLLIDSPAQVIHIVNAFLGWEVLKQNGKALISVGKRIYASVFSDGRDADGVRWSFPRFFFPDCWRYLSGVMCDTRWYPQELVRQFGVKTSRLHTVYFPARLADMPAYRGNGQGHVLWASRITESKRPDLLVQIARAMPEVSFDVFGYAADDLDRAHEAALRKEPNIHLRGEFESIEAIASSGTDYCAFLYTSAWDGLPNVLLEATAAGLPVVASAICGVPEFIDDETGYPVQDWERAEAYVARLREVIAEPDAARARWQAACARLRKRHGTAHFMDSLRAIPGYLSAPLAPNGEHFGE